MTYQETIRNDRHYPILKMLMSLLSNSCIQLSRNIDDSKVEEIGISIYQVMSARYRKYHDTNHILSMCEGMGPIEIIAAIFHDTVYLQVDKRIHPLLKPYLAEFEIDEKYECTLPDFKNDQLLILAAQIFQVEKGQRLNPFNGLNEFLSAVSGARIIQNIISEWELIQVIACIEATIPFRKKNSEGLSNFDLLERRLVLLNERNDLNLKREQIQKALESCVNLANRDVWGFFSNDFGLFLSQTWDLLLEGNPIFRNPLFTIHQYSRAVEKVEGFLSSLTAEQVVHSHNGKPSNFNELQGQVKKNLENSTLYLRVKLVAAAIIESFAILTGGDAPYCMLLGDEDEHQTLRSKYLQPSKDFGMEKVNPNVYEMFRFGRAERSGFDFASSPISAFLYENLSNADLLKAIALSKDFSKGKTTSKEFLTSFPSSIIMPLIDGIASVSWSRRSRLQELKGALGIKSKSIELISKKKSA